MYHDPAVEATLRESFAGWLKAIMARDVDALRRVIDEEWIYTDYTGHVHDRAEYFEIVGGLITDGHETSLQDFDARMVSESLALATGRYTSRGTLANGNVNEQDSRFTALWALRDGSWRCLAHQATNVTVNPFA
jgi:ketosteroid isomerase-like protein